MSSRVGHLRQETEQWRESSRRREEQIAQLSRENGALASQTESLARQAEHERTLAAQQVAAVQENLRQERLHAEALRRESDLRWEERLAAMKHEMQQQSGEQLAARQTALQESNRAQMDELLKPIRDQFAEFRKSVDESRTRQEVDKKEIASVFENILKLFQQEQQQMVSSLREQTLKIGSDAEHLAQALQGESKTQGDWGEMVLERMLESSGLRRGEEFLVQEQVRDEEGHALRPDVIVRFPGDRCVVIDAKVSLTAYAAAMAAGDAQERERRMKDHLKSVRAHVDELAEKSYDKVVRHAIGYVLMFIPNESGYIAAMRQDAGLSAYAYRKRIVILSPGNLLMALQLAYNLWQNDRRNRNVDTIVRTASDLYDKVAGFSETFLDVEKRIADLSESYATAKRRLYTGKGNVMGRIEHLKTLGVTPARQLRGLEPSEELPDEPSELPSNLQQNP
ncbi:MAG: DNA recombination protein RmuC [Bacteroidales bacterium]|nr:DNA recombination protein RmuC [Bacteroidales bacterium]